MGQGKRGGGGEGDVKLRGKTASAEGDVEWGGGDFFAPGFLFSFERERNEKFSYYTRPPYVAWSFV